MKLRSILGIAAVVALALMAFASSASATTLYVNGVKQTGAVTIHATLKSGTSALLEDTSNFFANTCTASTVHGETSVFTGSVVSGPLTPGSSGLNFSSCIEEPVVTEASGSLSVEQISGTTNGTVRSIGAKVKTPSPFGTLTCVTAASPGTDVGTLTGVTSGNATMDINAALNCGAITAKWTATYTVTTPTGLDVES